MPGITTRAVARLLGFIAGTDTAENRDYYNQAAAVGGVQTIGVGVGTLANRPASG